MDKLQPGVQCPLLAEAGIDRSNSKKGTTICLNCPFPICVYDGGKEVRQAIARQLAKEGVKPKEIARRMGLSLTTAYQYLRDSGKRG